MERPREAAETDAKLEANFVYTIGNRLGWSGLFGAGENGQADAGHVSADLADDRRGGEDHVPADGTTQQRLKESSRPPANVAADEERIKAALQRIDAPATGTKINGVQHAAGDLAAVMMEAVCETEAAKMDCEGLCDHIASLTTPGQAISECDGDSKHVAPVNDFAKERRLSNGSGHRLSCGSGCGSARDSDFGLSEHQMGELVRMHQAVTCEGDQGLGSPVTETIMLPHIPAHSAEISSLREEVKLLAERLSHGGGLVSREEFRENIDDFRHNIHLLQDRSVRSVTEMLKKATDQDCEVYLNELAQQVVARVPASEVLEVRQEVQTLQHDIPERTFTSNTAALKKDWQQLNGRLDLLTQRIDFNDQITEEIHVRLQDQCLADGRVLDHEDMDSLSRSQEPGISSLRQLWSKLEHVEHRVMLTEERVERFHRRWAEVGEESQRRLSEVCKRVEEFDIDLKENAENMDWVFTEFEGFKKKFNARNEHISPSQAKRAEVQNFNYNGINGDPDVIHREDLMEIKQEIQKQLVGQLSDLGRKIAEADSWSRQQLANLQDDLQEVRNSQLTASDDLAKQSFISDVDELRQDVSELAKTMQEVEECLTLSSGRLQEEAENVEFLHAEIMKLASRCDELQGLKSIVEQDLHEVKVHMQTSDNAVQDSPSKADYGSQIAQLAEAIRQDHHSEQAARKQLQTCVEGLSRRLDAMEDSDGGSSPTVNNVRKLSEAYEDLQKQLFTVNSKQDESSTGWTVLVERAPGGKFLGMQMNHASMVVEDIKPDGLIARWNEENPDKAVQGGDRITDVNGQRQPALAVRECQQARSLRITFSRKPTVVKGTKSRRRSFFLEE